MPRKWKLMCLSVLCGLMAVGVAADDSANVKVWRLGADSDSTPAAGKVGGGLLLSGGGGDVDEAFRWFSARCGGGDVVVLRASGGDGYQDYLFREIGGFASVTTILIRNRSGAAHPAVSEAIRSAEGVFLAGGNQARYISDWIGTPLGDELQRHVDAGKPLGGTSAGLAVLGQYAFQALATIQGDSQVDSSESAITSEAALRNPFDPRITLGAGVVVSPLMRGIITDSHFSKRNRLGRLAVFIARLQQEGRAVRGLGIDERTAVCVDGQGVGLVLGAGDAWVVELAGPAVLGPGAAGEMSVNVLRVSTPGRLSFPALEAEGRQEVYQVGESGVLKK